MGILGSPSSAGTVVTFMLAFTVIEGLKCLSCRGQNVYECIMSAMTSVCSRGEECRFRKLRRQFIPSRTMAWFEAGCASREECRQHDNFYTHFCCRISYCNYLPVGK